MMLRTLALLAVLATLGGCMAISVGSAVVGTGISVASTAVGAGVAVGKGAVNVATYPFRGDDQ